MRTKNSHLELRWIGSRCRVDLGGLCHGVLDRPRHDGEQGEVGVAGRQLLFEQLPDVVDRLEREQVSPFPLQLHDEMTVDEWQFASNKLSLRDAIVPNQPSFTESFLKTIRKAQLNVEDFLPFALCVVFC